MYDITHPIYMSPSSILQSAICNPFQLVNDSVIMCSYLCGRCVISRSLFCHMLFIS